MWLTDQINTNFISSMFPKPHMNITHTLVWAWKARLWGISYYLAISIGYFNVFKSHLTSNVGLIPVQIKKARKIHPRFGCINLHSNAEYGFILVCKFSSLFSWRVGIAWSWQTPGLSVSLTHSSWIDKHMLHLSQSQGKCLTHLLNRNWKPREIITDPNLSLNWPCV